MMAGDGHPKRRHEWIPYLLVIPSLVLLFALIYPIWRGVVISLQPFEGRSDFSALNYGRLIEDERIVTAIGVSFAYVMVTASLALFFGLIVALVLNTHFRGRALARGLLLLPWVLPDIPTVLVFRWMVNPTFGVANLPFYALGAPNPMWLSDGATALLVVILMSVWKAMPFFGLVILAALQSVPQELHDAARVDGASAYRAFRAVTLPWIAPALVVVFVIGVLLLLQQFALIWLLTSGGPDNATTTLSLLVYQMTTRYFDPSYGAAIGNVGLLIATGIASIFVIIEHRRTQTSRRAKRDAPITARLARSTGGSAQTPT